MAKDDFARVQRLLRQCVRQSVNPVFLRGDLNRTQETFNNRDSYYFKRFRYDTHPEAQGMINKMLRGSRNPPVVIFYVNIYEAMRGQQSHFVVAIRMIT